MPYGWGYNIYRQADGGASPATEASRKDTQLFSMMWRSMDDSWLEILIKAGKALQIRPDGQYTATARDVMNCSYFSDGNDWLSRRDLATCRPDEWLIIDMWDDWI